MVVVLKKDITEGQKKNIYDFLKRSNFKINEIVGEEDSVFAAVGKVHIDSGEVLKLPGVDKIIPISKPYKLASREFKRNDTVVEVPNKRGQIIRIGGKRVISIAGPSAVESREQIMDIAAKVAASGAVMLRGGSYRPRSSPYSFQGLGNKALEYLKEAGEKYGLPVVNEIVNESLIAEMKDYVDVFVIGARNMQDFDLLKKVGAADKPVILRRSYTATLEEFLMSAEYLMYGGAENVILCERGIRTFEHATHNTLDLSAIPVLRSLTHLPIIVDPCTAVGSRDRVAPLGLAAIACGADGVMVEVHDHPEKALCHGAESMYPSQFDKMMHEIEALAPVMGKAVTHIRQEASSVIVDQSTDRLSEKIICAYSGKRGAYAEQAVSRYFDCSNVEARAVDSFGEIFQSVVDGKADYGMVPIENSLAGSVYQNYDNFNRFEDVSIVGTVTLNIRHALLAPKGASLDTIKNVYSHPQGLSQCRKFLEEHKEWNHIDTVSTSDGAKYVSEHPSLENAAIASQVNAELYHLNIVAMDIEDNPSNFTRFVVIKSNATKKSAEAIQNIKPNTASFIFNTKNEPGALVNVLSVFEKNRLNLTRLESRPIEGEPFKYWFYADAELKDNEENVNAYVADIMEQLKDKTEDLRLLGIYSSITTQM